MVTREESNVSIQHIVDWRTGEAYFAIVSAGAIVKRLHTSSWREAAAALRAFRQQQRA